MAIRVVDQLEVVDVDDDQRDSPTFGARDFYRGR
jgi:hypothetical protein